MGLELRVFRRHAGAGAGAGLCRGGAGPRRDGHPVRSGGDAHHRNGLRHGVAGNLRLAARARKAGTRRHWRESGCRCEEVTGAAGPDLASCGRLSRPAPLAHLLRGVPGRDLRGDHAGGGLCGAGAGFQAVRHHAAGLSGQYRVSGRCLLLWLLAGSHRPQARARLHPDGLDRDGAAGLLRHRRGHVLGGRRDRRAVHGIEPVGGSRDGRPAHAA